MATGRDENSNLSDEELTKLLQFQEITGLEDNVKSRHILSAFQWDVQRAVQDTINEQEMAVPQSQTFSTGPQLRQRVHDPNRMRYQPYISPPINVVTRVVARQPQQPPLGWGEWMVSMAALPFRFLYNFTFDLFNFLMIIVMGRRRPPVATDPVGDVARFLLRFETEYGDQHPVIPRMSYSQISEQAKQDLTPLVVYLHTWNHQDTPTFCRTVICSQEFINFVNERNLLFWAVDIDSEEGQRVKYVLSGGNHPFVALALLKQSRMTMVGRFEGLVALDLFLNTMQSIIENNEPELVLARNEREERQLAQLLRQQQEEAFNQSLRADQEKEERKKAAVEEERRKSIELQQKAQERKADREFRINSLPLEPSQDESECVVISLRCTDGSRLERRFRLSDKLQTVYDFALSFKQTPESFVLATSYPRKLLVPDNDGGPQLEHLELGHKCTLLVQDTTEEED